MLFAISLFAFAMLQQSYTAPPRVVDHDHGDASSTEISQSFKIRCAGQDSYRIDLDVDAGGHPKLIRLARGAFRYDDAQIIKVNAWLAKIGYFGHANFKCTVAGLASEVIAADNIPQGAASSLTFFIMNKEIVGERFLYKSSRQ